MDVYLFYHLHALGDLEDALVVTYLAIRATDWGQHSIAGLHALSLRGALGRSIAVRHVHHLQVPISPAEE